MNGDPGVRELLSWIPWIWLMCPVLGGFAAYAKNAWYGGVLLGLLFGPLGVIAALGLDFREQCRRCGGRYDELDGRIIGKPPKICPHCGAELVVAPSEEERVKERALKERLRAADARGKELGGALGRAARPIAKPFVPAAKPAEPKR